MLNDFKGFENVSVVFVILNESNVFILLIHKCNITYRFYIIFPENHETVVKTNAGLLIKQPTFLIYTFSLGF